MDEICVTKKFKLIEGQGKVLRYATRGGHKYLAYVSECKRWAKNVTVVQSCSLRNSVLQAYNSIV